MFEIHATVLSDNIEQFKNDCKEFGCKSLLIELQGKSNSYQQLMTSQSFRHKNWNLELKSIKDRLENKKYKIDRLKVEINPYAHFNDDIKYYETHFRIKTNDAKSGLLEKISHDNNFHMSRNVFKNIDKNFYYRMATYRTYDLDLNKFENTILNFKNKLSDNNFEFDKVEVEACIFDTNDSIDQEWLKK
jgi:hypothetical protein